MIRAKFRCLSITTHINDVITANLKPVMRKGKNLDENTQFWQYTPSGELDVTYKKECPLVVGAYYFIDLTKGDGVWTLDSRNEKNAGYLNVELSGRAADRALPGFQRGKIHFGMTTIASDAQEGLKPVDSKWDVSITFAEPSDDL